VNTVGVGAAFHDYFHPVLANTAELRAQAYSLRYQVYCREFGFEREEDCPNQQERDDYDDQSIHCLLIHHPSGRTAGCVRLVLADPARPDAPFPFEKHCGHVLDRSRVDPSTMARGQFGEISRLAVHSDFRRRLHEDESPLGMNDDMSTGHTERRQFPYIALGLYLAAASIGLLMGLHGVFAMMELRLARRLSHYGIRFVQVGQVMDYHGPRAPFYIDRAGLLNELLPDPRALLDVITDDLENSVRRARLRAAP
jgi:N-acyl amino acid synthase of PEP-CTERM/exosortase system